MNWRFVLVLVLVLEQTDKKKSKAYSKFQDGIYRHSV